MLTYKQLEASREARLWIGQVIVPAIGVTAAIFSNPQVRQTAADKINSIKRKLKSKKRNYIQVK